MFCKCKLQKEKKNNEKQTKKISIADFYFRKTNK